MNAVRRGLVLLASANGLTATRRSARGFSLIETLVVMAIIGLIMGLVGPRVMSVLGDSREKAAKMQMQNLGAALEVFYLDIGRYPTSEEGLGALVQRPASLNGWNGPYLRGTSLPKDPWGGPFSYLVPGADGEPYDIKATAPGGRAIELKADGAARKS